jgi:hypothetical protein
MFEVTGLVALRPFAYIMIVGDDTQISPALGGETYFPFSSMNRTFMFARRVPVATRGAFLSLTPL